MRNDVAQKKKSCRLRPADVPPYNDFVPLTTFSVTFLHNNDLSRKSCCFGQRVHEVNNFVMTIQAQISTFTVPKTLAIPGCLAHSRPHNFRL